MDIHEVCENGNTDLLKEHILNGADINVVINYRGWTPLHVACRYGRVKCVQILIQVGANVNVVNYSNRPPLHFACEYGHVGCAELLIQAGANVNFKSNHRNFLHYACVFDNVECVELLIKSGADINVVDFNNRTPLHYWKSVV